MATAYLFYGDAGSKKEELAQALARALLCTRREISWYCPCQ
ncbi:MAG: DNA polymerase III subunit delta', partial [Candidatus Omnitrophica bacterium]|nr:DNA polymerase III subunit delta' [Candidatus Omnitrophota bacterium]